MAMDGNARLEPTDERLIPLKPRYLSLQESPCARLQRCFTLRLKFSSSCSMGATL